MRLVTIGSGMLRTALAPSGLALTPVEKWKAVQRFTRHDGGETSDYWFFVLAIGVLVILLALLWQASKRRRAPTRSLSRELFAENAVRRGLSPRERQILLAVTMRSGLVRSHDIFTTVEAFDRGAAKLLAECLRTRTADEIGQLKAEITSLREKLGFQVAPHGLGPANSRTASSRDIPVDSTLELTRRHDRSRTPIAARVVRNDDIELAVDLETPVETHSSDAWRVRYSFGMSVWEFDTTAAGGDGVRLMLNHSDHVRFVNRRRFPRVAVDIPVFVASFPFIRRPASGGGHSRFHTERGLRTDKVTFEPPAFVTGVVTELAGPGLRIEAPLAIRAGDRVIVAFQVTPVPMDETTTATGDTDGCIIQSVGQVRHWRSTSQGTSIAVELVGLNEADIDMLVRITNHAAARVVPEMDQAAPADQPEVAETADATIVRQEV